MPSTHSADEKIPAVVSLCRSATLTMFLTPSARNSGRHRSSLLKIAVGGRCGAGALVRAWHRQQIRIGMLNLGQSSQTPALLASNSRHRVCWSSPAPSARQTQSAQRPTNSLPPYSGGSRCWRSGSAPIPAIEERFHLVGGRVLLDAVEDIGSLALISIRHLALRLLPLSYSGSSLVAHSANAA